MQRSVVCYAKPSNLFPIHFQKKEAWGVIMSDNRIISVLYRFWMWKDRYPLVNVYTLLLKMAIDSGFIH